MPPNFPSHINIVDGPPKDLPSGSYETPNQSALKVVRSVTTWLTHMLIGVVVGAITLAAGKYMAAGPGRTHVISCTIGFQMLMAEGILCMAPDSWCSTLSMKQQRWVHTVLQIGGSTLALAGCFVMNVQTSPNNFNTYHAQFALAAMVFTAASLFNGLASLYAYEVRKCIPGILSKLTHICFGTVALITASISLCYGMNYPWFVSFLTREYANALLVMIGALTAIIIINPILTFYAKFTGTFISS